MERHSIRFIAVFLGTLVIVLFIVFDWATMVFFTTNLMVRSLKSNVINNLQSVVDNYAMLGTLATSVFGALFSITFEVKAFVFTLRGWKSIGIRFSFASGVLSLFGVIMVIPPSDITFSLQGVASLFVYALLAFVPSISLILSADLLREMLTKKMADGTTLFELIQTEFEQGIKEYFAPKKEKENPFTKLLTNNTNTEKSTITPYKKAI